MTRRRPFVPLAAAFGVAVVLLAPQYLATHWQIPRLPHVTVIDLSTED
jgi:hypothetical protein